ncbi:1796_t:CDS:1, partial [Acaulospora morrowiae]
GSRKDVSSMAYVKIITTQMAHTLIIVYFTSGAIDGSKDKEQQERAVKE